MAGVIDRQLGSLAGRQLGDLAGRPVVIGEIVRAQGLRGALRVKPRTDEPARFERLTTCLVWDPVSDTREVRRVTGARRHGQVVLLTLEGCGSATEAARLAGRLVAVPEAEAIDPGPGRFYPWRFEGATMETTRGVVVGEIVGTADHAGHALWRVRGADREHLVPVVPELIATLDLPGRRVVIDPPEGLFDL